MMAPPEVDGRCDLPAPRGQFFEHSMARAVTATVHPSAILRAPDDERRRQDYEAFVRVLEAVRRKLATFARDGAA